MLWEIKRNYAAPETPIDVDGFEGVVETRSYFVA